MVDTRWSPTHAQVGRFSKRDPRTEGHGFTEAGCSRWRQFAAGRESQTSVRQQVGGSTNGKRFRRKPSPARIRSRSRFAPNLVMRQSFRAGPEIQSLVINPSRRTVVAITNHYLASRGPQTVVKVQSEDSMDGTTAAVLVGGAPARAALAVVATHTGSDVVHFAQPSVTAYTQRACSRPVHL